MGEELGNNDFQSFVEEHGAEILRFCVILTASRERGSDLYQDTMLTLLSKKKNFENIEKQKSYALSVCIFLWKNEKKKYAVRRRLAPTASLEALQEEAGTDVVGSTAPGPEETVLKAQEKERVREAVYDLPEKYRIPIELYYSADASLQEIADTLHLPLSTVKTRLRRARMQLKEVLEDEFDDR